MMSFNGGIMDVKEIIKSYKGYQIHAMNVPKEVQGDAKKLCHEFNLCSDDEIDKRNAIMKQLFGEISEEAFILPYFRCDYGYNIFVKGMCFINYNVVILDTSPVVIHDGVMIGPNSVIACASHPLNDKQRREGLLISKPIIIEKNVWIGANVTICGGVTIGEGSVIGAGSVVTKSISSRVIAYGSPCKVQRKVSERDHIDENDLDF